MHLSLPMPSQLLLTSVQQWYDYGCGGGLSDYDGMTGIDYWTEGMLVTCTSILGWVGSVMIKCTINERGIYGYNTDDIGVTVKSLIIINKCAHVAFLPPNMASEPAHA